MSTDFFALLGQRRQPWLEAGELKEAYHRLAAQQHPDKTGEAGGFAELNAAFQALSDPVTRLRHWLQLEVPEALGEPAAIPAALGDAFLRIATLRRNIDAFVKQQTAALSPLKQAVLAGERFALQRDVEKELVGLTAAEESLLAEVRECAAPHEAAPRLAAVQQEMTFLAKWSRQLREALFALQSPG